MSVEPIACSSLEWEPGSSQEHARGVLRIPAFAFECGAVLPEVRVAFETWGQYDPRRDNAIVVCHALTGDAHAGPGDVPGWWEELIGPGCPIDTRRWFVVASNVLGGCAGSSGPSSIAPDGRPYGLRFPLVTVRDMVRAQIRLLDALGVDTVHMVIGGSLGGMQVWEWPLLAPGRVRRAVAIAAHAAFTPLAIGYNEAMRQAIVADPNWHQGDYYSFGVRPEAGLAAARSIGMLTYRSDRLFEQRFGRSTVGPERPDGWPFRGDAFTVFTTPQFQVESYLHHHGEKLNRRFDANSYLYLTRAMDSHDIGRGRGGLAQALRAFDAELLVIGIDSDYLYTPEVLRDTVELAQTCGVRASYRELSSVYGHDAFLAEQLQLARLLEEGWHG
jgi:homoserine O-acetyltransferase